ncbi:UNVERIFIED_CONTAM: hypothetical protein HDU68_001057 [Siphonaria sp. JEL0065]|nr:hypothetical protein HDU68_001057 [Siphonaria sp. JEL0065]
MLLIKLVSGPSCLSPFKLMARFLATTASSTTFNDSTLTSTYPRISPFSPTPSSPSLLSLLDQVKAQAKQIKKLEEYVATARQFNDPPPLKSDFESESASAGFVQKVGFQGRVIKVGPRGGEYYMNQNGNKSYLRKCPEERELFVGPRGGQHYINKSGKKSYISKVF